MDNSPRLGLPYLQANQAQKHVTLNEALRRLDMIVQASVLSSGLTSPPLSPAEGDCYLIAAGPPAGDWSAQSPGDFAAWQDGAWAFITPLPGWTCLVRDTGAFLYFDGSQWRPAAPSANPLTLGVNAVADDTNRLSVKSDAELLSHDDVTPGTGDARKIINKSAEAATASLLLQTDFSGRAEIGLTGDDDLQIKVSGNGSVWQEALRVSHDTGYISLGTSAPLAPLTIDTRAYASLGPGQAGLLITGTSGAERAEFRSVGPAPNAAFQGFGASGTPDAPTATPDNSRLFAIMGSGHDGSGFVIPLAVQIDMRADGAWSAANHGGYLTFRTTPAGSTVASNQERMRITSDGKVGVATTAPSCALHVDGPIRCGSFTVAALPDATVTGAGSLIHVSDESGGAVMAFSDGTNWRRVTDRAVVS